MLGYWFSSAHFKQPSPVTSLIYCENSSKCDFFRSFTHALWIDVSAVFLCLLSFSSNQTVYSLKARSFHRELSNHSYTQRIVFLCYKIWGRELNRNWKLSTKKSPVQLELIFTFDQKAKTSGAKLTLIAVISLVMENLHYPKLGLTEFKQNLYHALSVSGKIRSLNFSSIQWEP